MSNEATTPPAQSLSEKQMHKALAHHQAGQLKEAEDYYRQVLRLNPDQPDANNLLGVLLFQTNRSKDGLQYLERAVQLKPNEAMFYYNYGIALRGAGDQAKAAEMLGRCIQLNPEQVDALNQLVGIHEKRREWDQAINLLKKLSTLKPLEASGFRRLGDALHHAKRFPEAAAHFSKACGLEPNDAHLHHQLGLSLQAAGDSASAAKSYRRCIELKDDIAPAHNNLAIVLAEQGDDVGAVKHYERALELNPGLFQTKCNLGGLLRKTGGFEDSVRWLQSAVDQKPDCGEAWCNLGNTLGDMGNIEEAMQCYRRAILARPDYPQARLNRSIGLLRQEKFEEGWVEYEWRYNLKECPRRNLGKPRWDGRPLGERVLLVHAEQGLGDTMQMVRYVQQLRRQGCKVVLECQKPLVPFLTINDVADEIVGLGEKLPNFDLHLPLMSLPSVMHAEFGFLGEQVPYLSPADDRVLAWKDKIGALNGRKIGLFWQGNPEFKQDRFRSIPLQEFSPLFDLPNSQFISLQKGAGTEQLDAVQEKSVVRLEGMDENGGAFMDSAAILKQIDLLVTSDSAIAHLAGALGVRTFLLLPFAADWRWFIGRNDSPWYPSVQLFRKAKGQSWRDVIDAVKTSLLA